MFVLIGYIVVVGMITAGYLWVRRAGGPPEGPDEGDLAPGGPRVQRHVAEATRRGPVRRPGSQTSRAHGEDEGTLHVGGRARAARPRTPATA